MATYMSLRSYATLDHFDVRPLHATADDADMQLKMTWSTVVGTFTDSKRLHVIRNGNRWEAEWPLVKEPQSSAPGDSRELSALGCDLPRPGR